MASERERSSLDCKFLLMKNTVFIYHTRIPEPFTQLKMDELLRGFSEQIRDRCLKYVFPRDQQARVAGKTLLLEGLRRYGVKEPSLDNLRYTEFGRPFLRGNLDFNISHSAGCVAVAIAKELKIGIDVEAIRPMEIDNFLNVIPRIHMEAIISSPHPQKAFLEYWTKAESILKAIGGGLSIPLESISIRGNLGYYRDSVWHLRRLDLGEDYCAHVAANVEGYTLKPEFFTI
jgi:4'-phosphopantetheinyl transferase